MSEKVRLLKNEKGAALSWTLIVVISLIAVVIAATYLYLQRPEAPEPQPVVVRMKIPPISSPAPGTLTEVPEKMVPLAKTSLPVKQDETSPLAPAVQTNAPVVSSDNDGLSTGPAAPPENALDDPVASSTVATDMENPPPIPAIPSGDNLVDPKPEDSPSAEKAQKERILSDDVPPTSVAGTQEKRMPSDEIIIPAEKDAEKDSMNRSGSPGLGKNIEPHTVSVKEQEVYTIQVGAYREKRYADQLAADLKALKYSTYMVESTDKNLRPLYKVCFGRFESKVRADESATVFRKKTKKPAFVVSQETP